MPSDDALHIGLISDTHGLLLDAALHALAGCNHIVHAGDICDPVILDTLARIAPVTAVRGNNDFGAWAQALAQVATVRLGALVIRVIHDIAHLPPSTPDDPVDIVVYGHSHRPLVERRDGMLFVNPGSAGPRRFRLPISVGRLHITGRHVQSQLHEL